MNNTLFFATRADLVDILRKAEATHALKYTRTGSVTESGIQHFFRGEDIPQLGVADADNAVNCASYLVSSRAQPVAGRTVPSGITSRTLIDQLINPDTILLSPGGLRNERTLLSGRIGSVSEGEEARALVRLFATAMQNWETVKQYKLGPEAMSLLQRGIRLTISTQSPASFDLRLGD